MTYREVGGDLLARRVIGHGVNAKGVMNAGLAKQVRQKYPGNFQHYKSLVGVHLLFPGRVYAWREPKERGAIVFNLVTQFEPGPEATLWIVRSTMMHLPAEMRRMKVRHIYLPRLGCGIGGLQWKDVRKVIREAARDINITVVIPEKGE